MTLKKLSYKKAMHLLTRPDFSTTPRKKPSLTQCTFVFTNLGAKYKVFCSWQKHREWEWRMTFFECFTVLATWALASTYLVLRPCKSHRAEKNHSPLSSLAQTHAGAKQSESRRWKKVSPPPFCVHRNNNRHTRAHVRRVPVIVFCFLCWFLRLRCFATRAFENWWWGMACFCNALIN